MAAGRRKVALLVTNLFPNSVEKTRGMYNWQEAMALSKVFEVKVLAPVPYVPKFLRSNAKYFYHAVPRREVLNSIEVCHPRYLVTPRILRSLYGQFMFWGIQECVKSISAAALPDFVIAYYVFPDGYAGVRIARKLAVPVLVKALGSEINLFTKNPARRWMTTWTLKRADRVVAVSHALKTAMTELGIREEKIQVVANGVDTSLFRPNDKDFSRGALGLEKDPVCFLFVGQMREVKGVHILLRAFENLPDTLRSSVRLIMIGSGELDGYIDSRLRGASLSAIARRVGTIPHREIPLWMNACDCLILPSLMEGCPNVVIEALACRRPVICSRVGGIPEIVAERENGWLVPAGNSNALTEAIVAFVNNGVQNPMNWSKTRSWDEVAAETAHLVEGILQRKMGLNG